MTDIKTSARDLLEDTKLITPAQARAVLRVLRERAEKHAAEADLPEVSTQAAMARASALRHAADQIGDLIQSALDAAVAEQAERAAKQAADKLAQEERARLAGERAEAYRTRPILGLREDDLLVSFPNYGSRWAGPSTRHIGWVDETITGSRPYYRTRCGADANASHRASAVGEYDREATCKRCLAIAKKEGLL